MKNAKLKARREMARSIKKIILMPIMIPLPFLNPSWIGLTACAHWGKLNISVAHSAATREARA